MLELSFRAADSSPRRTRACGFTLVELMVVLAIVAILSVTAVPSLSATLATQRVRATGVDLMTSLLTARSEAVKRNAQVSVAPNDRSDWTTGWRVAPVAAGAQIDRRGAVGEGVDVTRAPAAFVYDGNGRLTTTGVTRVEVSDRQYGAESRCIVVDPSGMPRLVRGGCA